MFTKVNENSIVNTDNIVWIDSKKDVVLTDGTRHSISEDCSHKFFLDLQTVNTVAKVATNK